MLDPRKRELWFLTGSQHLYGDETLKQVAEDSRKIAEFLDRSGKLPVRVVWKPTLTGPDEILNTCIEANSATHCVGVVAWMHTFSPAKMWIGGLTRLEKPLAHLHTQFKNVLELASDGLDSFAMNAESLRSLKRFAGKLQDDPFVDGLAFLDDFSQCALCSSRFGSHDSPGFRFKSWEL